MGMFDGLLGGIVGGAMVTAVNGSGLESSSSNQASATAK